MINISNLIQAVWNGRHESYTPRSLIQKLYQLASINRNEFSDIITILKDVQKLLVEHLCDFQELEVLVIKEANIDLYDANHEDYHTIYEQSIDSDEDQLESQSELCSITGERQKKTQKKIELFQGKLGCIRKTYLMNYYVGQNKDILSKLTNRSK